VRNIPGQGFLYAINPFSPDLTSFPLSSRITGSMPGIGKVAEPGFSGGSPNPNEGEITNPPVSVCQYVSIMGQFDLPIIS